MGGRGGWGPPQIAENRTPGKSTQNHLTILAKDSNVIDIGQGGVPSRKIVIIVVGRELPLPTNEEPPRGATRGVQQLNREEVKKMELLFMVLGTVLALPVSIVAVIQLWQMLKSGHGRHRK